MGEVELLQLFFYICNEIRSGSPATESIGSGLGSCDTLEKTEQQAEEDPTESVDNDASAFDRVKFC